MRTRLILASLVLALLAIPTVASAQTVIPLTRYHKALWTAEVLVDGKPRHLLFDTGGGMTMLAPAVADATGCRWWGRVTGYDMFGKRIDSPRCDGLRLSAGGVVLTPATVGRLDLGDRIDGDDDRPDGMLSLDAFDGRAITLDMGGGRLIVETPESLASRIASMREVPMRLGRGCNSLCLDTFVGVPLAPGMAWFTLDSGAGGVSLVARDYAQWVGVKDAEGPQTAHFELAPGLPVDTPMVVTDLSMDGHLGQPFLSRQLVTLDLAQGRMWIAEPGATASGP